MNCDVCQDDFSSEDLRELNVVVFNYSSPAQKIMLRLRPDSDDTVVYMDREMHVCETCYCEAVQPLMAHFQKSEYRSVLIGALLAVPVGVVLYSLGRGWFEYGLLPILCGAMIGKWYHDSTGAHYRNRIARVLDVSDVKEISAKD